MGSLRYIGGMVRAGPLFGVVLGAGFGALGAFIALLGAPLGAVGGTGVSLGPLVHMVFALGVSVFTLAVIHARRQLFA